MRLVRMIIAKVALLAVVLSISLSGFGMSTAHASGALDAVSADSHDHHAEHMMPGAHDHHAMHEEQSQSHDGHANCPMVACCHTGGAKTPYVCSLTDAVALEFQSADKPWLAKAEPENAKKPPKHI